MVNGYLSWNSSDVLEDSLFQQGVNAAPTCWEVKVTNKVLFKKSFFLSHLFMLTKVIKPNKPNILGNIKPPHLITLFTKVIKCALQAACHVT